MPGSFQLPKIYPITDRKISGISHVEQIARLKLGGATFVQIREKSGSSFEFYELVRESLAVHPDIKIIVNDRVDIALVTKAHGVHLGQNDLPPAEARKLLGDDAIIGCSTHSLEQVRDAVNLPINYLAFGPVFETATKSDHDPIVGLEILKRVRDLVEGLPLVAIGGINLDNLSRIFSSGADSAAMISALVGDAESIVKNTQKSFEIAENTQMLNIV
jgi:thiamine-phosphate pyrophosphorylase